MANLCEVHIDGISASPNLLLHVQRHPKIEKVAIEDFHVSQLSPWLALMPDSGRDGIRIDIRFNRTSRPVTMDYTRMLYRHLDDLGRFNVNVESLDVRVNDVHALEALRFLTRGLRSLTLDFYDMDFYDADDKLAIAGLIENLSELRTLSLSTVESIHDLFMDTFAGPDVEDSLIQDRLRSLEALNFMDPNKSTVHLLLRVAQLRPDVRIRVTLNMNNGRDSIEDHYTESEVDRLRDAGISVSVDGYMFAPSSDTSSSDTSSSGTSSSGTSSSGSSS